PTLFRRASSRLDAGQAGRTRPGWSALDVPEDTQPAERPHDQRVVAAVMPVAHVLRTSPSAAVPALAIRVASQSGTREAHAHRAHEGEHHACLLTGGTGVRVSTETIYRAPVFQARGG